MNEDDYWNAIEGIIESEKIDMAVILTEGIIKDIIDGNPSKIVQTFVQSPLIWGIHVASDSKYQSIQQIRGKKAAISRFGSGSHLMAYVNAQNHNWDLERDLKFEVIKNLDGAVDGLTHKKADYFLWEKFTTKPLVDKGVFRRIGEIPTPWPCFVIAARESFIDEHPQALKTILDIINETTSEFKQIPSIDRTIANRYRQQLKDVQEWLSITEWSQEVIDAKTVSRVQDQLLILDIIAEKWTYEQLVREV